MKSILIITIFILFHLCLIPISIFALLDKIGILLDIRILEINNPILNWLYVILDIIYINLTLSYVLFILYYLFTRDINDDETSITILIPRLWIKIFLCNIIMRQHLEITKCIILRCYTILKTYTIYIKYSLIKYYLCLILVIIYFMKKFR